MKIKQRLTVATKGISHSWLCDYISTRLGIGGKLLMPFSLVAALTTIIGLVAWVGFSQLIIQEQRISDNAVPNLISARRLSDLSSKIVYTAQSLGDAETEQQRQEYGLYLSASGEVLARLLADFSRSSTSDKDLETLRQMTNQIIENLARLGEKVGDRIVLEQQMAERKKSFTNATGELSDITRTLVANADTTVTANITHLYSFSENGSEDSSIFQALDELLEVEMDYLQRMMSLDLKSNQLRNSAVQLENPRKTTELDYLKQQYSQAMAGINHLVNSVNDPQRKQQLQQLVETLKKMEQSLLDARQLIDVRKDINQRNESSIFLFVELSQEVDRIVSESESSIKAAGADLEKTLERSQFWILFLILASLLIMILTMWRLVYIHLVRRLVAQTEVMERLAKGDLEARADASGYDELAKMANAIEVFRQNALARQKAEQASEAKTRFLAHMSHEIRTPMNGVLGMLTLLRETRLDRQQFEYVEAIGHSGEILLDILNDILDYSKIEAGHLTVTPVDFDCQQLMHDLSRMMAGRVSAKGLDLQVIIDSSVPNWLQGDAVKIRQVMLNLLGNAIKFTDHGCITIALEKNGSLENNGYQQYRFSVSDTGKGIACEDQKQIFQAFTQAGQNINQPGTGLGLPICQRMVSVMKGELILESTLGQGSCFAFTLCLKEGVPQQQQIQKEITLPSYNVLLVEDNPVNQKVARGYLEKLGQKVCISADGAAAKAAIISQHFDLVLMDINLPDTDGVTLSGELRQIIKRHLPVIAVSAHVFAEEQSRFIEAGMDACLAKPLRISGLSEAMMKVMSGHDAASVVKASESEMYGWLNEQQLQEDIDILGLSEVQKMAELFKTSAMETLQQLVDSHDLEQQENLAHNLKGAAASMGLMELHQLASDFEKNPAEGGKGKLAEGLKFSLRALDGYFGE